MGSLTKTKRERELNTITFTRLLLCLKQVFSDEERAERLCVIKDKRKNSKLVQNY